MDKNTFVIASSIGTNFVANVIVGMLIGFALDYYLHNVVWFFIFLILGVCSAVYTLYKDTKKLLTQEKKNEKTT
ncbi:MAG: AtpZ/AtpI family protein [Desulfovibrionaceae bacterium]|nr:AtpZ/AtpI family protein [Desulfovibrionaceae bacterium]